MKTNDIDEINEEELRKNSETFLSYESNIGANFFYNNTEMMDAIDDIEILKHIAKQYPNFNLSSNDTILRKTLIQIVNDNIFVTEILDTYNIDIFDLFKIFYKYYSSIFKTTFLKNLKNIIANKEYVNHRKK